MSMWNITQNQGQTLSTEVQIELESLVNTEFNAAITRTASLVKKHTRVY
jgi:hypothetical protein